MSTEVKVIPVEEINSRFDRIESKIDKLSDAMISLARTEEKIMAMESERSHLVERINRHSEKLDDLNDKVNDNARTVNNINKLFWIVVVAAIGAIASNFLI